MNKKLIIAAVSAAVMAPVAAHAESSFYGKIGNVYKIDGFKKKGVDTTNDLSTLGTRLGFKANSDIGNGLTTHGQLEFDVGSDKELPAVNDVRVGSVGLSGAFGRVDMGNMWSAYFNTFGSNISPTYSLGYHIYSSAGGGPYRASNTIKYSNNFGPVHVEVDARFNESKEGADKAEKIRGEGLALGVSFAPTDWLTIGLAADNENGVEDAPAVAYVPEKAATVGMWAQTGDNEGVSTTDTFDPSLHIYTTLPTAAKDQVDGRNKGDSPDTERVGISGKASLPGGLWVSLGFQKLEVDADKSALPGSLAAQSSEIESQFLYLGGSFTDNTTWLLGRSEAENKSKGFSNVEADQTTWGVYHSVGGGLTLLYEASAIDFKKWESAEREGTKHLVGMRINF